MTNEIRFVAYYRVSTRRQGSSGLGIEAQRTAVSKYLDQRASRVVAEFTEIESGRRNDRPALERALMTARVHQAALVVAKVDRLTRSVGFLSRLLESGIDVRFADLPAVEGPTGRFMLQQMAAVAELEAGMISARTRAALAAAKDRGRQLGGFRGTTLTPSAKRAGRLRQSAEAQKRATDLAVLLAELTAQGCSTAKEIAAALTERGVPTARGKTRWSTTQVSRIQQRLRPVTDRPSVS